MRSNRFRACMLLLLVALSSCFLKRKAVRAVVDPSPRKNPDDIHTISKLIPFTIRVRRPAGPGANPKAGPGGEDYRSTPLPDARLDCQTFESLFKGLDLAAIRSCVMSIQAPIDGIYRLRRAAAPFLELEPKDDTPDCLRKAAPKLPVPREIIFQSNVEGRVWCYSSRIDVEADEVLGSKVPTHRSVVKVEFPVSKQKDLLTDDGIRMLLASWVLTPYWEKDLRFLTASLVTDELCSACIGEKNLVTDQDAPPVLWP